MWIVILMVAGGCASPPGGLDSPVPLLRLQAIAEVAKKKDESAIPKLITFLNSDDPAVRMASIRTLESLTGQTLGYDHAGAEDKRLEAMKAWVEWYNQRGTSPGLPERTERQGRGFGDVLLWGCERRYSV